MTTQKKLNMITCCLYFIAISVLAVNNTQTFTPEKIISSTPSGVLIADPWVVNHRVGAPAAFKAQPSSLSTIQINFLPPGSPAAQWGDITIAWPTDASNALIYAVGIWESLLNSTVPLTIDAGWVSNLGAGILGHSGTLVLRRDFTGAPLANTYYPATLANALNGSDLDPGINDIYMGFSSTFSWYTGTDGNPSGSQYDLVSVVLHEICHGLGFAGGLYVSGGLGKWWNAYPNAYDRFTEDNAGNSLIDTVTYPKNSVALKNVLTSGNVFFDGTAANTANGGNRVELYAPGTWNGGSSYSHLGQSFNGTPNALMTYSLGFGESEHSPGPVTEGLLQDIGWTMGGSSPTQVYLLTVQSQNPNTGVTIAVNPLDNNGAGNGATTFTRNYNSNTTVNLTAPATAGSNPFDHWKLDGGNMGGSVNLSVDMLNNHTAIAVYQSSSTQVYMLTVQSQNPNSGVSIQVTPNDNDGFGNGATTFSRNYNSNTTVNLTAPATAGSNPFDHWKLDGGNMGGSVNLSVGMLNNHTAIAVYQSSSSGTSVFTSTKFKGKIIWKAGNKYQLGNVKIIGSIDSSLNDLNFLSGVSTTNLIVLNSSFALPCSELNVNKKGTVAKAKTKVNANKITAKLKLKKGKLYLTYNNKNCTGLPSALNIINSSTTDWQSQTANLYIAVGSGANNIIGEGTVNYEYKTKVDKKTTFKTD